MRNPSPVTHERRISHRHPRKVSSFTWSRVPGACGSVTYRLFRRDMRGALHCSIIRFEQDKQDRCAMAQKLRSKRHELRDRVDTIDLHLLGVTQ